MPRPFLPSLVANVFTHPPRRPRFQTPRTALGLSYERFRIRTGDGIPLSGWCILPADASPLRGLVVLSHGYSSCRETMLPHARFLLEAGYATVLYDFRSHGWSGGSMVTFGFTEAEDLHTVLEWVSEHETLASLPLFLMGESMGAVVSLFVGAQNSSVSGIHSSISGIIADSAFARFDSAIFARFEMVFGKALAHKMVPSIERAGEVQLGIATRDIAPLMAISVLAPCPLFLIHGGSDKLVPPANALKLYAMAQKHYEDTPERLQFWLVENAPHARNNDTAGPLYEARVLAFLRQNS
jgi:uncharacterized protein